MPGTHLLPPNLLKLFSPRPPLVYTRPVDRDIDRVTKKDVSGVGTILSLLREGAMTGLVNGTPDGMEEGEEPTYTLAEEIKRQIRREDRKKKRAEEFQKAKDSCTCISSSSEVYLTEVPTLDKPQEDSQAVGDPYKTLFISRLVCLSSAAIITLADQYPHSTKTQRRMTFAENLKCMAQLNGSEL
jgi:U1 small nuclear ribonucleoprotein